MIFARFCGGEPSIWFSALKGPAILAYSGGSSQLKIIKQIIELRKTS